MRHALVSVLTLMLAAAMPGLKAQAPKPGPADTPAAPRAAYELPLTRLKADATVPLALTPGAVAVDKALWVATPAGVVVVDSAKNVAAAPVVVPGGPPCATPAHGSKAVWVPQCAARSVARIDETSREVVTAAVGPADAEGSIAACVGSVWMATDAKGVVSRLDPETREVVAEVYVAREPSGVTCADDAVWVTSAAGGVLTRVNAHTNEVVETIAVGPRPGRVVVGEGGVWTLNRGDHSVSRVDPATNKVVATIAVGHDVGKGDIAVGEGGVWLSAPGSPLVRIDPRANRVAQRFTGDGGGAVAVAQGSVWIAGPAGTTWRIDPKLVVALRP
jgi:virginiamycin B lyase